MLLEWVFGLRAEWAGLRLDPCLPGDWPEATVSCHFRGADYAVGYDCRQGHLRIAAVSVNGAAFDSEYLPCEPGARYEVLVTMA